MNEANRIVSINKLAQRARDRLGGGFIISSTAIYNHLLIEERYAGPNPFESSLFRRIVSAEYAFSHFGLCMGILVLEFKIFIWMREHGLV